MVLVEELYTHFPIFGFGEKWEVRIYVNFRKMICGIHKWETLKNWLEFLYTDYLLNHKQVSC